jgi:hypothetical protein
LSRPGAFVDDDAVLLRRLIGTPIALPQDLAAAWPELAGARFRHGGLPPRIGGWFLGAPSVAGLALGRTVWLDSPAAIRDVELLLHEVRHVQQFATVSWFPCRYLWQSIVHGYHANAYEVDARAYASRRASTLASLEGVKG